MNSTQQNIKDWMSKFGQDTPTKPTIPSLEVRKLRAKLILEEALETIVFGLGIQAFALDENGVSCGLSYFLHILREGKLGFSESSYEPNLEQIADGVADLNFVSYGTAIACGIDMEEIESEVLRSNLSKLWTRREIPSSYPIPEGYTLTCVKEHLAGEQTCSATVDERSTLMKDQYGKIIKSPSYSPANIQPILDKQSNS